MSNVNKMFNVIKTYTTDTYLYQSMFCGIRFKHLKMIKIFVSVPNGYEKSSGFQNIPHVSHKNLQLYRYYYNLFVFVLTYIPYNFLQTH